MPDKHQVEQFAVGVMLASAQGDVAGVARLAASLTREELIGCLAYCARFAVAYARTTASDDAHFHSALQGYALALAGRP